MSESIVSRQNGKWLLAVGEEVTSISDIFVNDVTIADLDIAFAYTKGGQNQPVIEGFESLIAGVTDDLTFEKGSPNVGVTHTINLFSGKSPAKCEVGFFFPNGLYFQAKNGEVQLQTFEVELYARKVGDSFWFQYANASFRMSSIAGARASIVIMRPDYILDTEAWEVKVIRLTAPSALVGADNPKAITTSMINFTTFADAYHYNYSGTALLAIWVEDLAIINNRKPTIKEKCKGMQFYVPAVEHYNPDTKVYTGSWDGTFPTKAFTTNPAYILYSLLSDKLSKLINIEVDVVTPKTLPVMLSFGVPEANLGISSFYKFAKYCDETFLGAKRYEFNKQFVDRMGRKDFLDVILSACNARLVRKHGLICIVWDKLLSNLELEAATVLIPEDSDNGFTYSRTHFSERYTNLVVVYEDVNNQNLISAEQADSTELLDYLKANNITPDGFPDISTLTSTYFVGKYGYNPHKVELIGAVSKTSALVKARSLLYDVLVGQEFLALTGENFNFFHEGQVIATIDTSLAAAKESGRIKSWEKVSTLYHVTLLDPLTLADNSYVYFYVKDASLIQSEDISPTEFLKTLKPLKLLPHASNFGVGETSKTLQTWIFALTGDPIDNTPYVKASQVKKYWTISSIDFADEKFTIKAKRYLPEKFGFIESSYTARPVDLLYSQLSKVTNIVPKFSNSYGFTSVDLFIDVTFSHAVALQIAQSLVISYEVSFYFLHGSKTSLTFDKTYSKYADPNTIPLTTLVTQTHHTQLKLTLENYWSQFPTGTTTLDAHFLIEIKTFVKNDLLGIKPSPIATLSDIVTLTKPASLNTSFLNWNRPL